jgi:hypothetical protein
MISSRVQATRPTSSASVKPGPAQVDGRAGDARLEIQAHGCCDQMRRDDPVRQATVGRRGGGQPWTWMFPRSIGNGCR